MLTRSHWQNYSGILNKWSSSSLIDPINLPAHESLSLRPETFLSWLLFLQRWIDALLTHTIVLIADGQTRQALCVTKGPYRKGFSWSRALGLSLLGLKVMGQFTTPSLHQWWKEVIGSDESEPEEQHHQQAHGLLTETVMFMCSCEHATHEHKPEINYSATYWEKCGAMVKSLYHTRTVWLPYLHLTVIKCFCKIILQE